ncbi:unnamed protein product, partial [Symbiodinium sp. CCMP2592]
MYSSGFNPYQGFPGYGKSRGKGIKGRPTLGYEGKVLNRNYEGEDANQWKDERIRQAQLQRERHRRDGGIGVALQKADGPLWTAHAEVDPILGDCAPSQDSSAEEEEFPGDLRPPCEESNQARWHEEKEQWYQEQWHEDVKESERDRGWWRQQPAEEKKLDARAQETGRDWQTGDYLHQQRQKESHLADMAKFASLLNRHNLPREAAGAPATLSSPIKTSLDGQSVEAKQTPDTRQQPQEPLQEIREEEAPPVEG